MKKDRKPPLALTVAAAAVLQAHAQIGVAIGELDGQAMFNALAQECYEAGLASAVQSDSIMDCSGVLDRRATGETLVDGEQAEVVVQHKVRFTLIEGGGRRIAADAWTETEELGTTIEEPFESEEYAQRVQRVLTATVARLAARDAPPWSARYESEQAWHLDAHLRAVRHCDANLGAMTAESVAAQLESIGLRPLQEEARDRCEQLYAHLFEWSLARGDEAPTVQKYSQYRAALPPEQRICSGQLARDASCPR